MASKITKTGWKGLYIAFGIVDVVQIIIDFFPPEGETFNEIADPVIGGLLFAYFQTHGVSMLKYPSRLASLLGVAGLEELTGGIAPAWIIDIWYIKKTVMKEEAAEQEAVAQAMMLVNENNQPVNSDGVRAPKTENVNPEQNEANSRPLYSGGIGRPRGK